MCIITQINFHIMTTKDLCDLTIPEIVDLHEQMMDKLQITVTEKTDRKFIFSQILELKIKCIKNINLYANLWFDVDRSLYNVMRLTKLSRNETSIILSYIYEPMLLTDPQAVETSLEQIIEELIVIPEIIKDKDLHLKISFL